jgi:hypothetical protein
MGRSACTEPQCLYSRAILLLSLWAVRPVQSLSACKVELYLYSPYGPYGLYSASVPVQGWPLYLPYHTQNEELYNVQSCVTYSNHWNLKDYNEITKPNEVDLLVLNKYGGIGMIPLISTIGTRWISVASFTMGSLYPAKTLTLSTGNEVLYGD